MWNSTILQQGSSTPVDPRLNELVLMAAIVDVGLKCVCDLHCSSICLQTPSSNITIPLYYLLTLSAGVSEAVVGRVPQVRMQSLRKAAAAHPP